MSNVAARLIDQGVVSVPTLHGGEPVLAGTATTVRAIARSVSLIILL